MDGKTNLLKETKKVMRDNKVKESDVQWVGNNDLFFSWDHFKTISDVEYDASWGAAHVAQDLVVVGSDWWLERHEYDGSEWWEFKKLPKKPEREVAVNRVVGGMWDTIEALNKD